MAKMTDAEVQKIMHGPVPPMAFWELVQIIEHWATLQFQGSTRCDLGGDIGPLNFVPDCNSEGFEETPRTFAQRLALGIHTLAKQV